MFELPWLNTQCCIVMLARSTRALKSTMAFGGQGRKMSHTTATSGVMDFSIQNALSCLSLSYVSGDITGCNSLHHVQLPLESQEALFCFFFSVFFFVCFFFLHVCRSAHQDL